MDIKNIDKSISVSGQIEARDMKAVAKAGFKSVICNRPDGETGDQTPFREIEEAAQAEGLVTCYLPVISGQMTQEDVTAFGKALDNMPSPVFAYCRSGTRCATLWALDQSAKGADATDILAAAQGAGYDLSGIIRR